MVHVVCALHVGTTASLARRGFALVRAVPFAVAHLPFGLAERVGVRRSRCKCTGAQAQPSRTAVYFYSCVRPALPRVLCCRLRCTYTSKPSRSCPSSRTSVRTLSRRCARTAARYGVVIACMLCVCRTAAIPAAVGLWAAPHAAPVAQIARSVVTRMHGPYETIFRAGSIADTLFMIDRGVIAYSPNATTAHRRRRRQRANAQRMRASARAQSRDSTRPIGRMNRRFASGRMRLCSALLGSARGRARV